MTDESQTDALVDDVLSQWAVDDPPQDFAARVAAHEEEEPMPMSTPPAVTDRSRSWIFPAAVALAAAALVWLWVRPAPPVPSEPPVIKRPPVTETPTPEPVEVEEPEAAPVDREQLEARWKVISRDIRAANQLYPFGDGDDLSWEEFDRLYSPTGEVAHLVRDTVTVMFAERDAFHPVFFDLLERVNTIRDGLYFSREPRFAVDLTIPPVPDVKEVALVGGDAAVRFRNTEGSRTFIWRPATGSTLNLSLRGFGKFAQIESSGPWAPIHLLQQGEDLGPEGRFEGPFRFDFSQEGLEPVVLRVDDAPNSKSAAELRRVLTRPLPAPRRLFVDPMRCPQAMFYVASGAEPGFCVDAKPVTQTNYKACADVGGCEAVEVLALDQVQQYCAWSSKTAIDATQREALLDAVYVADEPSFRCVADPR